MQIYQEDWAKKQRDKKEMRMNDIQVSPSLLYICKTTAELKTELELLERIAKSL